MTDNFLFLSAKSNPENPHFTILGLPHDGNSSGAKGSAKAPGAIRQKSHLIETYSPYQNLDLESLTIADAGNLELSGKFPLQDIQSSVRSLFQSDTIPVFLGGDHSVTIPLVKSAHTVLTELYVLILDAHADLRDEYEGTGENHACVSRRIAETVGFDKMKIFGVRSGTREEFKIIQEHDLRVALFEEELDRLCRFLEGKPVYLSLDLDIFDPGILPGTGCPEPGGITYNIFLQLLHLLRGNAIVGIDIVELCPELDPSGSSSVLAASCVRELILLASAR